MEDQTRAFHAQYEAGTVPTISCGVYTRSKSFTQWLVDQLSELHRLMAEEEHAHSQTIADRDLREDQVTRLYWALGGENEWSSAHDLGDEAIELAAELEAKAAKHDALVSALRDLHAIVWGECPSLLNEDSGGDAGLDVRIRELLGEKKTL